MLTNVKQIAKTIISMFVLLEIARIYKVLQLFADLLEPICYKDPQNKEVISQLIRYDRLKFAYHFHVDYDLNLETAEFLALVQTLFNARR